MLCLLVSIGFQVLFHSPPGVLFTFPSRYYTLSVTRSYLALGDGPPAFPPDFACPVVLRIPRTFVSFRLRVCYSLWSGFPAVFCYKTKCYYWGPYPGRYFYPPVWARSLSLTTTQEIDFFLSLPPGTKMFQFPGFPSRTLCIHVRITRIYPCWVPSFGNLRIKGHLHLPAAYRSLSRPSSAPSAKASTLRSY